MKFGYYICPLEEIQGVLLVPPKEIIVTYKNGCSQSLRLSTEDDCQKCFDKIGAALGAL